MVRIVSFLFLFLCSQAWAQNFADVKYYLVDSLELDSLPQDDQVLLRDALSRYHSAESDTGRINALTRVCDAMMHDAWMKYQFFQYELIMRAMNSNPSEAEKQSLRKSLAISQNNIGYIHKVRGNMDSALAHYSRALDLERELGDQSRLAQVLNNIGVVHKNQGNIALALEYYHEALKVQEALEDKLGMASSNFNLGSIHLSLNDMDLALEYYQKALTLHQEIGSRKGEANAYNNIGVVYKLKGDLSKALEYHQNSLDIKQKIGDKAGISDSYINVGAIQEALGDTERAYENYDAAREISEDNGYAKGIASSYVNLAKIKFARGEIEGEEGAMAFAKKSLHVAEDIGFPEAIRDASGILFRILDSQHKYKESLEMHKLFVRMKDSVSSFENQKASSERQAKYEYEKQKALDDKEHEKELALGEEVRDKQRIMVIAAIIGLVLVVGFLFYVFNRLNVTRRQKQTIESQKAEVDKAYVDLNIEKAKGEELLLNILPEEIAEELKEKGTADAKQIEQVSVLFTDFRGFTALSEKLAANELVNELNVCFSAFDAIMDKYGVEKIKTIGDAYMAVGGLPVPNETHAQDVVHAALDIQDFMLRHNAEKRRRGEDYFDIRIGIHSGPVVAGIVGVKKFQYDIWGDTVNTASRMETSGETGKVNISAHTHELIKDFPEFEFEFRGEIEAKGKGMLQMYFVERKG